MRKIIYKIDEITGNIATLKCDDVGLGELAVIESRGRTTLGQVISLSGQSVSIQVFGGARGLSTNDKVRFLGRPMQVRYGESLLGRIFNGSGDPIGRGPRTC